MIISPPFSLPLKLPLACMSIFWAKVWGFCAFYFIAKSVKLKGFFLLAIFSVCLSYYVGTVWGSLNHSQFCSGLPLPCGGCQQKVSILLRNKYRKILKSKITSLIVGKISLPLWNTLNLCNVYHGLELGEGATIIKPCFESHLLWPM